MDIIHKKQYFPPRLTPQEHLRDLTLGGTPGSGESPTPNFNPLPGERRTGNIEGDNFSAFDFSNFFDDPS